MHALTVPTGATEVAVYDELLRVPRPEPRDTDRLRRGALRQRRLRPAGEQHGFVDITEPLELLVVVRPAEHAHLA